MRNCPLGHVERKVLFALVKPFQLPCQKRQDKIVNSVIFSCRYKHNMLPSNEHMSTRGEQRDYFTGPPGEGWKVEQVKQMGGKRDLGGRAK